MLAMQKRLIPTQDGAVYLKVRLFSCQLELVRMAKD